MELSATSGLPSIPFVTELVTEPYGELVLLLAAVAVGLLVPVQGQEVAIRRIRAQRYPVWLEDCGAALGAPRLLVHAQAPFQLTGHLVQVAFTNGNVEYILNACT